MGKTSSVAKNRYRSKAYDQINIIVPKGEKDALKAHAKSKGYDSLNAYTKALYEADSGLQLTKSSDK